MPVYLSLIHIYTGSGIPETEQAKIFARFYRSNSVQKQEGVGIGLYLARQIISGEGGYIKVDVYKRQVQASLYGYQ